MHSSIFAAALLASTAAASSVGSAVVVNACEYDVYICNVPASGGGYTQIDKTLSRNGTYQQTWTELANSQGWSIKLSMDSTLGNIMQYEYTFHNDGTIWYDLSDVNGNPWDGNWEITATNEADDCDPKDQAYRYSTDDAYGMQACSQDSVITVTLCSGESQDDSGAASASSAAAEASYTDASSYSTPTSAAPSTIGAVTTGQDSSEVSSAASTSSTSDESYSHTWGHDYYQDSTTLSTVTSASSSPVTTTDGFGVTVTEVDTAIVTDIVTATAYARFRRDMHHQHHHGHNHA
ncbi:hypothetical protein EJ03DRAFT_192184 [Teratosphaeria nubilosa]|uniref:Uncharacterized protein n=1 Tax=Teratosphaeria nubilosa TaxID=161662 RepID=A0A6G1KZP9_9PEZI|nr:hypothetical protein EJ03DRAFT_192184 [Teratosphaeria nubilosa]